MRLASPRSRACLGTLARLDLREPNREAVQSLAAEVSQYYDVDEQLPPFESQRRHE